MKEPEMKQIGEMVKEVLIEKKSVKAEVLRLCQRFPIGV